MDIQKMNELSQRLNETIYNLSYSTKYQALSTIMNGICVNNISYDLPITTQGYVFFGRPKLNLSSPSVKNDRILSCLNTLVPNSLAFAIRCYLDPIFSYQHSDIVKRSPLINDYLPYIPILTNTIQKLTGWDDSTLEVETTEGGFFNEDITFAKGAEDFTKTRNLTATFSDLQGNPVLMIFMLWFRWIMLSTKSVVMPYNKYIEENKISYSFSIYRFRMDTSGKFISFWSRGIGCFPTSYPIADKANYDRDEQVSLHSEINIPIVVNFSEHMDPIDLSEFNMWIKRWCPNIESWKKLDDELKYYFQPFAIPYINFSEGKKELEWRVDPSINLVHPRDTFNHLINEMKELIK